MSAGRPWRLDRRSLGESLARWEESSPDLAERHHLNEWLMDLVQDPLHRGREDPDHPGIFFGRVGSTNLGVTFVPDTDHRVVYVTNIA